MGESFRALEDRIPRGARVIVADTTDMLGQSCITKPWPLFYRHIPILLSIDRGATTLACDAT